MATATLTPRGGLPALTTRSGKLKSAGAALLSGPQGNSSGLNFVKLVERTTESLVSTDDGAIDEVRRTLLQVRQQYDSVHHESEQKEARLKRVREEIRQSDMIYGGGSKTDEVHRVDDYFVKLEKQHQDTLKEIFDTKTSRKVYSHMLARIQKEQAILRQKMLRMEEHLDRKRREVHQKRAETERAKCARAQMVLSLQALNQESEMEKHVRTAAKEVIEEELEKRRKANGRRQDFESWRHEIALEAANEAFNASAGRLRKIYALEKLAGNSLQKITIDQVERSQNTEDGFQRIREVTGLADVMDIVHKFLNRDVEHDQLKGSVKEAEVRLEALRQKFDSFKQKTEGFTFDDSKTAGGLYKEVEFSERALNEAMDEHEACRLRLQKATLQTEHMKRWSSKIGHMLSTIEEPLRVEEPKDLPSYFKKLEGTLHKFVKHVTQQIMDGRINREALSEAAAREYNDQNRLMMTSDFLKANLRVQAAGRPHSRQGTGGAEDDPATSFAEYRSRHKPESEDFVGRAQQKRAKGS